MGGASNRVQVIGSSLVIDNVTVDDEGFYTCDASNVGGTDQARAYIVIFGKLESDYSCSQLINVLLYRST